MSADEAIDDCLLGGGEAGALMRAMDWSKNPLGPVSAWPRNLKILVSAMLAARFGMRILWGPEFIFLYNDGYRPVLGVSKHPSAMGSRTRESFREVWPIVGPLFENVYRGEASAFDDVLLPLDRNGYLEECYFTLSYSPIRNEDGSVGGVLGVVHETTERVLAERRLITLHELAMATSNAKTPEEACQNAARTLERSSADLPFVLCYLMSDDGRTAHLASAVGLPLNARVTPASIDLFHGAKAWPLAMSAFEVVHDLESRFGELHAGPYPEPIKSAVVLPLVSRRSDQPYGYLVGGVNPRHILDDKYRAFFELATEHLVSGISSAIAHQQERAAAEALATSNRELDQFAYVASHDLKAPLRGIANLSQWIEEALIDHMSDETKHHMNLLRGRVHRLEALIDGILSYSRAARARERVENVDVAALLTEVRDLLAPPAEASVAIGDGMPIIEAERVPLQQVFLNLIGNALKHARRSDVQITVKCVDAEGAHFHFAITDNGPGIAPEYHERIWTLFSTLEARDQVEGTGIGLSVVKKIVESRGGKVSVESAVGAGATFHVYWPKRSTPQLGFVRGV